MTSKPFYILLMVRAIRGAPENDDRVNTDTVRRRARGSLDTLLVIPIECTQRCTKLRLWSSKFGDEIGDWDWVNSEMRWRPWLSEFGDALGGHDQTSLEMHFEDVIKRVWKCNWRSRFCELRDTLRGRDQASLELLLEIEIEWTQRCALTPWSSEFGDAIGCYGGA